jgi:hypothetical protein
MPVLAHAVRRIRYFCMGPSNDHELEIAREVDKYALHEELDPDVLPEILAFLDFKMSSTDRDFLNRYIEWRMANPIRK